MVAFKKNQSVRNSNIIDDFLAGRRWALANKKLKDLVDKQRLLDIGCGFYPTFLVQSDFQEKYGCDPMLSAIEINGLHLKAERFTDRSLPFVDNFFQAVTALAVIEHIDWRQGQSLVKEMFRVLAPGGRLILTTPTPWTDRLLRLLAAAGLISKEEIAEHKVLLPIKLLKSLAREAGFVADKIKSGYFELGMNQWLVADKK